VLLAFFLAFLLIVLSQDQPSILFLNYRVGGPTLICSIDISGAPGPQWKLSPPDGTTVFNLTVVPTNQLGKYHIIPGELYDCGALYQDVATYAIEAVGSVVAGRKYISLVIHQYASQGYPRAVKSISVWQNGTSQLICGINECGTNGAVLGSVAAAPMACQIM